MDCQQIKLTLSAFQDGCVVESERRDIAAHVLECSDCASYLDQLIAIRRSVRAIPKRPVPANLKYSLRATASREAARRRRFATLNARLRHVREEIALVVNNMMRPIAVPATGGLASAVLLFSMVMTNFQGIVLQPANDIPIALATEPSVKNVLMDASEAEIIVDVFVDETGRVIDYSLPDGYGALNTSQLRRKLENTVLFTEFSPATIFGQPTSGWVRVKYHGRSQIDVQG